MLQTKELDKTSKITELSESEITNLPDKEFKVMVIKMLSGSEWTQKCNKETKYKKEPIKAEE